MGILCFVLFCYAVLSVLFCFAIILIRKKNLAACFTLIFFLMSCNWLYYVALPLCDMGWFAVCDYGMS